MKKSIKYSLLTFTLVLAFSRLLAQNGLYFDDKHNFLIPMTENNEIKGYAYVYKQDRVSKDSNCFIMEVYDELLRDVGEKKIVMPTGFVFHSAVFNGANFVCKFVKDNEAIEYRVFDQQATQVFDTTLYVKVKKVNEETEWNFNPVPIRVINNQGMIDYVFVNDHGNTVPMIIFLSNDFNIWQYSYPHRSNPFSVQQIGADERFIINAIYEYSGKKNTPVIKTSVQVLSAGGVLISEMPLNNNDSVTILPIKADIEKGSIKLVSEYTKRYARYSRVKFGICLHDLSPNGQVISSVFNEITQTMKADSVMKKNKLLVNSYLFMHKAVRLKNGNWLIAAEQFQKTHLKIDLIRKPTVKYNKYAICLMEVDADAHVVQMHVEANKGDAVMLRHRHYRNPEMGSMIMYARNHLDFSYFLQDNKKNTDRISFIFTDYFAESARTFVGNILYDDGKFTVDKFRIAKFSDYTRIATFPARFGRLLLIKYDYVLGIFDFDNIKFNN